MTQPIHQTNASGRRQNGRRSAVRKTSFLLMTLATTDVSPQQKPTTGYAPVNGLNMYYEVHGSGEPVVLLHGAFMTIHQQLGRVDQRALQNTEGHCRRNYVRCSPWSDCAFYQTSPGNPARLLTRLEYASRPRTWMAPNRALVAGARSTKGEDSSARQRAWARS